MSNRACNEMDSLPRGGAEPVPETVGHFPSFCYFRPLICESRSSFNFTPNNSNKQSTQRGRSASVSRRSESRANQRPPPALRAPPSAYQRAAHPNRGFKTPSAPMMERSMVSTPSRSTIANDGDKSHSWYNVYCSMHSERDIPMPKLPATLPVPNRALGCHGCAQASYSLAPGRWAVIIHHPNSGYCGGSLVQSMDYNGMNPDYCNNDFGILDYPDGQTAFSEKATITGWNQAVSCSLDFNSGGSNIFSYAPVPWIGGFNPRSMIQPQSLTGAFCRLGASISVEVVSTMNGSATIYGIDTNQNSRQFGSDKMVINQGVATSTLGGSYIPGQVADPVQVPFQPLWMPNGSTGCYNPVLDDFVGAYRKISLGGNGSRYAYVQIAGDNYWQNRGMIVPGAVTEGDTTWQGSFPISNAWLMLMQSKGAVIVQNTSVQPITINVMATAMYGAVVDPTVSAYSAGNNVSPHVVPNMDWLTTATVGEKREEAYFAAKRVMLQRLEEHNSKEAYEVIKLTVGKLPAAPMVYSTGHKPLETHANFLTKVRDLVRRGLNIGMGAARIFAPTPYDATLRMFGL